MQSLAASALTASTQVLRLAKSASLRMTLLFEIGRFAQEQNVKVPTASMQCPTGLGSLFLDLPRTYPSTLLRAGWG